MAHLLEMVGDKASMAYAGDTPWHGLGVKVPSDLTPEQMMEAAQLDWAVEKKELFADYKGQQLPTGTSALIRDRDSKVLDVVSNDWNPVQNAEAFGFFHDFVMEGSMNMDTAGSLKDGRIVWALAKVDESFELFNGDRVESYLLFTNPHQYGKCIDIRFTPIRVVCNNTLTLSLKGKSDLMVKVNHAREFNADLVKQTLGVANKKMTDYKEAAQFLGKKKMKMDDYSEYLQKLFPITGQNKKNKELSRPAQTVMSILESQPGAEFAEGSWWQGFNSATYYIDHLAGNSADTRLQSAWYGSNRQKKVDALNLALEYAE